MLLSWNFKVILNVNTLLTSVEYKPIWCHDDVITTSFLHKTVFSYIFLHIFCAEGQHSQKILIKNASSIHQIRDSDLSPFQIYECLVLQRNIGFQRNMNRKTRKDGTWYSLHPNCSQLCANCLGYFSRYGLKYIKQTKTRNLKIQKVKNKQLWRHPPDFTLCT